MKLSLSERSLFYDEVGKLLAAGFPFLKAIETMLSARPRQATRQILENFQSLALQDCNITDSFSAPTMPFSQMEISLISACEKSGQLQRGFEFLTRYYARLDSVWRQIIRRATYPLFMFHFGLIMLAIPKFFQGNGMGSVVSELVWQFGVFYLLGIAFYIGTKVLVRMAVHSLVLDRILGALPLFGNIRRSLALSRFCTTYHMQLDAGVNVMDSLDSAARASASARILSGIIGVLPAIRAGQTVGPELARIEVLPPTLVRGLVIGEQTGTLDAELARAANEYEAKALRGIETFGDWMPKIIYFIIVGFLAWGIISAAKSSTAQLNQLIESDL